MSIIFRDLTDLDNLDEQPDLAEKRSSNSQNTMQRLRELANAMTDDEFEQLRLAVGYTDTLQAIEENPEMAKRIRRRLRKLKLLTVH